MLSAEVTIAAPPEVVRGIFLDFPSLPKWHSQSFFNSFETLDPAKTGMTLKEGDSMKVILKGMPFGVTGKVEENSPNRLVWHAILPVFGSGRHVFEYTSGSEPNTSIFKQSEEFTGLLWYLCSDPKGRMGSQTVTAWEGVNGDLKVAVEKAWKEQQGK